MDLCETNWAARNGLKALINMNKKNARGTEHKRVREREQVDSVSSMI